MPVLYLIDGHAQIFRAYFAIRGGMRSPVTGEPTHAVFGVAGVLFKLLGQLRPDYVVVATDAPGPTFRDEIYTDYKGHRDAMPEDLAAQLPRVRELVEAFGIPYIGKAGLEADDVIACIVDQVLRDPACADLTVRIVSRDKDLEQLLCDRVSLYDIHTDVELDVAGLYAAKGIRPDQVIDWLTLTGDTVDNVPGVEGIGPKTASALLQQFGTVEGILAGLDQLKGKQKERLEAAREQIPLSRHLVTLKCDDEVGFTLEAARVTRPNLGALLPMFQQMGFNRYQEDARRLVRELGGDAAEGVAGVVTEGAAPSDESDESDRSDSPSAPERMEGTYAAVTTLPALEALAASLRAAPIIAVDTETTGLGDDALLCGLCFSWEAGQGVYVPVRSPEPDAHLDEATVLAVLGPVLEDAAVPKCGHNLKFDARQLLKAGVRLRGIAFDSMLATALLEPDRSTAKLDDLALAHLGHRMIPITALIGEGPEQASMATVPLEQIVPYAAEDADISLRLYRLLTPKLEAAGMGRLMAEVEGPLVSVLAEMEHAGILCDPEELLRQGEGLAARVLELRAEIHAAAGCAFHVDSPRQLEEVLFDRLGFTASKRTKTGRSTDITVLERLAAQEDRAKPHTAVPRLIIEYRQLQKLIGTYLGNLREAVRPSTARIHTTFHQLVTATGRLASNGPNLQNIPVRTHVGRQIRRAFHAPEGHSLICADYSQIELRLLAHLSGDTALKDAFERGLDIHTAVAAEVFGVPPEQVTREQRGHAKTINFGIIYGVTAVGLSRRIEGLDVQAAARLIEDYKSRFPGINAFLDQCVHHALEHGYVATLLGRRRAIPEIVSSNRSQQSLGERLAINTVVQGSAADLIKVAMVNVQRRIERDRLPLRLLLQIHDELVLECPAAVAEEAAAAVRDEMERALPLSVPLRAEAGIGRDWLSAK